MLDAIITSRTRLRLLIKFFINTANQGYLRGLADEFNESTNAIRKELNNLSEAGYLEKDTDNNKIQYKANVKHPLFKLLQEIVRKYIGLDTIVENILLRMGGVESVYLIGDYAEGRDSGCIEVVVVGNEIDQKYVEQLGPKIEKEINRRVIINVVERYDGLGMLLYENKTN